MTNIPTIETPRLTLTLPNSDLVPAMVRYVEENRSHFAPWEPTRPNTYYTEDYWILEFTKQATEFQQDRSMCLVLLDRTQPTGTILGQCNFRNFIRGSFQACHLGYNLDYRYQGKGLMYEALTGAINYSFADLELHRIMANYMPTNVRSGKLLRRLGFTVEGYARDYLYLAGAWQDHILTALTEESWYARSSL